MQLNTARYLKTFIFTGEAETLVKQLEDVSFTILNVGYFTPNSNFSESKFSSISAAGYISATTILAISPEQLVVGGFMGMLDSINTQHFVEGGTGPDGPKEKNVFVSIMKNLFTKICERVYLSSSYDVTENFSDPIIERTHIGIGSAQTLHGYPDSRVRAKNSEVHLISHENDASESPVSDGDSIIIEGKRSTVTFNVHQLIATTIVASFTEMNLHPDQNPLIPVIMICVPQAKICFYDCKNDLLIMSETFNWVDRGKLRKLHMLLVWLAIHHRYIYVLCYSYITSTTAGKNISMMSPLKPTIKSHRVHYNYNLSIPVSQPQMKA